MKLNYRGKRILVVGRWMANTLLCLVAIAFVWQGAFFSETNAIAAPATLIAADVGDQIKGAADEVRARSKDLIRDTQDKVEKTANKNAASNHVLHHPFSKLNEPHHIQVDRVEKRIRDRLLNPSRIEKSMKV